MTRMRQGFFVGDDAEVNMTCAGLDGDVERQPMRDDGQRVKG